MSALTEDKILRVSGDEINIREETIGAGQTVFAGGFVMREDASPSTIKPGADTAAHSIAGVALDGGTDGEVVKVRARGVVGNFAYGPANADRSLIGKPLCLVDDNTVALAADTTNEVFAGYCWEVISTGVVQVYLPGTIAA